MAYASWARGLPVFPPGQTLGDTAESDSIWALCGELFSLGASGEILPGRPPGRPPAEAPSTLPSPPPPRLLAAVAVMLLAAATAWELAQVTSESVLVLPGGVGYVLESVRWCGLRRRRFLDAREVSYVTLSEVVTSCDVRFFLGFVPRPDKVRGRGGDGDTGDGGSGRGRLAVPFENLLPRLKLRHLKAIYWELEPPTAGDLPANGPAPPPAATASATTAVEGVLGAPPSARNRRPAATSVL